MENFVLSCCSTADLSLEHFQNRNIHYICFHYELNGTVYPDDLGQSMPFDVFYEAMTRGAETKSFQVNVAEFEAYFVIRQLSIGQESSWTVCLPSAFWIS